MISIIVPVYNASTTIERCVDSILSQTIAEKEIILVNDGSKDNSLEVIQQYADQYENIAIIDKSNGGVSSARNAGLEHATGEYIAFIDSDDYYTDENYLCNMLNCLTENKDSDLAVSGYTFIGNNGEIIVNPPNIKENMDVIAEKFQEYRDKGFLNSPWNKLFKRELILEKFCTNMTFGEDAVFVYKYLKNCSTVAFCEGAGYGYENRNPSSTASYRKNLVYDKNQTFQYYDAIAEVLFTFLDKDAALDAYIRMRSQAILIILERVLHNSIRDFLGIELNDMIFDPIFQKYSNDIQSSKRKSKWQKIAGFALRKKQCKIRFFVLNEVIQVKIEQIVKREKRT